MMFSIYDSEINEFTDFHWTQDEDYICNLVKEIYENEPDRMSFYEFEDEKGNKYDCWDINRIYKLGLDL